MNSIDIEDYLPQKSKRRGIYPLAMSQYRNIKLYPEIFSNLKCTLYGPTLDDFQYFEIHADTAPDSTWTVRIADRFRTPRVFRNGLEIESFCRDDEWSPAISAATLIIDLMSRECRGPDCST